MIQPEKFFDNPFDDRLITNSRLYNFGSDCLNRLTAANSGDQFTTLITQLTASLGALADELNNVDTGVNQQKGKTDTVDDVMVQFKKTMSAKEGVIADVLGGKGSPAYLEFFPHGMTEYSSANKTQMPLLVNRVKDAATAYNVQLGGALFTLLTSFATSYTDARNLQQQQMGDVEDSRTDRDTARTDAENALLTAIHTIALMFLGNVQACMQFFDFSLLFAQTHKKHLHLSGSISVQQIKEILNRSFTDSFEFVVRNTGTNADIAIYRAATPTEQPNGQSKEIKSGKALHIKPSEIGGPENTFLLIKNLSEVNEASYEVEVSY